MGSSTAQCALSRETIKEEQEVVTFLLEPNASVGNISKTNEMIKSQAQHYQLCSLMIKGKYADFQQVETSDPKSNAIKLTQELYGVNFSEEQNDEMGSRGEDIKLGGGTTEYDGSDTLQWSISKVAYDALMSSTDMKQASKDFQSGKYDDYMKEIFHPALLDKLNSTEDKSEILTMIMLTRALNDVGLPFQHQSRRTSQTAFYDDKSRVKYHAMLKTTPASDSAADTTKATWTCFITGNALAPGDEAYIVPIDDKLRLNDESNSIFFDDHRTAGMYGISCPEIKAIMNQEGGFDLAGDVNPFHIRLIKAQTLKSDYDGEPTDKEVFDKLINGDIQVNNRMNNYRRNFMVFSKESYEKIMPPNNTILIDGFDKWKSHILLVKGFMDEGAKRFSDIKDRLPDDMPEHIIKGIDSMFYDHIEDSEMDEEERANMFKHGATGQLFRMDGEKEWTANAFTLLFTEDYGMLSDFQASVFKNNLVRSFNPRGSMEDVDLPREINYLENIAKEYNSAFQLYCKIQEAGLSISPSHCVESELTVTEQRLLNNEVKDACAQHILQRKQEWESECGM